jgi:hypothetical protein
MSAGKVTIHKMEGDTIEAAGGIRPAVNPVAAYPSGPGIRGDTFVASGGGKRRRAVRRTTKTFPKGILRRTSRIIPSSNPSAPDGGSRKSRKHRLRLTTAKGSEKTRKNLHARASKTDIKTIRADLEKRGIVAKDPKKKIPEKILRTLYEDSVGAGLL